VKLLYGGAFRAPSAYETWYAHGPYKGNLALTPERIRTAEAVVEQHLGRRYRASANVFKYWVEDLITQVVDPADGQFVFENDGDARTTGVELEVEGRWPRGVSGRVSYARQRAVDVGSGLRLDGAPGQVAQVAFTFPLLSDDVQAAVDVQAVGERRAKTGDRLAGYAVPNLTIAAPALWHHLDVSFSIYNVLNRRYIHPVSDDVPVTSIAQDGRTVRLRAVWRF